MNENSNIFINKKILIYGLGTSGISSFKFLKKRNQVFLFDDNNKIKLNSYTKKNLISLSLIKKIKFDLIVISPGINNKKCKLNKFLKKNSKKHYPSIGEASLSGVIVDCDLDTGLAEKIEPFIYGGELKNTN